MSRFFYFKQKTAYEMRISDWSSDVCSSDLLSVRIRHPQLASGQHRPHPEERILPLLLVLVSGELGQPADPAGRAGNGQNLGMIIEREHPVARDGGRGNAGKVEFPHEQIGRAHV